MKNQPSIEACHNFRFRNTPETLRYFYHPDHIGSTSWVTDNAKNGIQYCEYLPFGEPFLDQRSTTWNSRYTFSGKERDNETGYSYFGARYYNSDISIWLSVDPMSDKYPNLSSYAYCANNPIVLVDPDGEDVYVLFYTKDDDMYKSAAHTRARDIKSDISFDASKDIVLIYGIDDMAQVEQGMNQAVADYSDQYGQTAEVGIWSHAGVDGPRGDVPTSGGKGLDENLRQMSAEAWGNINFNWKENGSKMGFYGCNTGLESNSFAKKISGMDNFKNVNVWGQSSTSYPSYNPESRSSTPQRGLGFGFGRRGGSTYMVGGSSGEGFKATISSVRAHKMNIFRNGKKTGSSYQPRGI